MSDRTRRLLDQACSLSTKELTHLVADLNGELEARELSPEWEAEIKRRLDDIDAGKAKMIPWETVQKRLERTIREGARRKRSSRSSTRTGRGGAVVRRGK